MSEIVRGIGEAWYEVNATANGRGAEITAYHGDDAREAGSVRIDDAAMAGIANALREIAERGRGSGDD